ncbi:hypothetical protein KO481_13105 [Nocardia sp. NEAU-G5]|uniref:Uncharacterized protein n=1 Tax=Nocardia albiluteola TaxID=2842303 RepID=A0ABS6AWN6_9NOCA|nr:hypothetical protein [Nocardia albiluteola]MBU3062457.1 hypothetical protein [Nocardia albiluteola]
MRHGLSGITSRGDADPILTGRTPPAMSSQLEPVPLGFYVFTAPEKRMVGERPKAFAHVLSGYKTVDGVPFPTRREIVPRLADGSAAEPVLIGMSLSDIEVVDG